VVVRGIGKCVTVMLVVVVSGISVLVLVPVGVFVGTGVMVGVHCSGIGMIMVNAMVAVLVIRVGTEGRVVSRVMLRIVAAIGAVIGG